MSDKSLIRRELIPIINQLEKERNSLSLLTLNRVKSELKRVKLAGKVAEQEANTVQVVWGETNEAGKPLFGNESTRKAEVTARLARDDEFCGWLKADMRLRLRIGKQRAHESMQSAIIKKLEALERLYLADYERED